MEGQGSTGEEERVQDSANERGCQGGSVRVWVLKKKLRRGH